MLNISSKAEEGGKMSRILDAFPRFIEIAIRCQRYSVARKSLVRLWRICLMSQINCLVSSLHGPKVSTANAININLLEMLRCLFFLITTADAAASLQVELTWEGPTVSTQVASQTSDLLWHQGNCMMPSGRFPSVRLIPVGSRTDGTRAKARM